MQDRAGPKVSIPLWQPIFSVAFLALFGAAFMRASGDWRWGEGWIFVGLFFISSLATTIWMYLNDPALFKERFSSPIQQEQKSWDKIVIVSIIASYLVWYFIMPLDAGRFGWSPQFPIWLKVAGFVTASLGYWMFFETFRENTFAAPVVKMQEERRQTVISTGLYRIVRHPLYTSATLMAVGSPLLVGSVYGLVAGLILASILAIRSIGEERMLARELNGYADYMKSVRWRLIPHIF
jgi:protein-S-isoprenylcysteine O-methyltransferase Ste14